MQNTSKKTNYREWRVYVVEFFVQIVENSLDEIIIYAEKNIETNDIMTELQLSVRIILNTDGVNDCKSPATSTWPLFIAFTYLPKKRQSI